MKKLFFIFLTLLFALSSIAQMPLSFKYTNQMPEIDHISINPPNQQTINDEIALTEKTGTFYRVATLLPVNANNSNSGTWTYISSNINIWQLRISCQDAKAISIYFDKLDLPANASLYVYSNNREIIDGPYYRYDNPDCDEYMIGNILGDDITIELDATTENADIQIGEIGYVFRDEKGFEKGTRAEFGSSESCEVNVNCTVGEPWRIQQRGVARVYVREGWSAGYCTGTLINNTSNDGTPYFLTANHCGPDATTSNFNQWKFRFNYEADGCTNPSTESAINYTDITGCTKVAEGAIEGGSDFYLLRLKNFTTSTAINIGAVYNGWTRATTATSGEGACIHHPAGDIKKISFYTSTPTTGTFSNCISGAHWKIQWYNNGDKTGVTEGGSSGSPIFNSQGLVFGTLSGGASSCSASTYSRNDLYGKFSYHWNNSTNGTTDAYHLQPWLDPQNTGAMTCPYYDPALVNIESELTDNISIYPNPTSKLITIEIPEDKAIVKISNILGQIVYVTDMTSNIKTISLENLESGMYFVSVKLSQGTFTNKIIVE